MNLTDFNTKLKGLEAFVKKDADKIISDESSFIADLNRERMYNEGKGEDNVSFGNYRPFTVFVKKLNRPGHDSKVTNVTLKDTGSFYDNIKIKPVKVNEFEVISTSETAKKLKEKPIYKDALGLTEKESNVVGELIAEKLVNDIVSYFQ